MKKLLTILAAIICINANAQSGWLWAKGAAGSGDDYGNSVATDDSGFVYVTGSFQLGTAYYYITKYSATGNSVWTKIAGGDNNNGGSGVATDHNGNIYVTGYFSSTSIIFENDTLKNDSVGNDDIFIAKYDRNGNVLWAKRAGGKYSDDSKGITVDNNGNVCITGAYNSTSAAFGTYTLTTPGAFVAKYDANGNVLWATSSGGGNANANSISADGLGNTYITGFYGNATISFGSTSLNNSDQFGGTWDVFVFKFDASGNALWGKTAGATQAYDLGCGVAADSIGDVYVTGGYQSGSISFGSTTLTNIGAPTKDGFIVKYSSTGSMLWAQGMGGSNWDSGLGVTTDKQNNAYLIGNFMTDISFGAFTLSNVSPGTYDVFMVKYDQSGAVLFAQSAGGSNNDTPNGIAVAKDKSTYITGNYTSPTISFGNNTITNLGGNDIFLAKYYSCSDVNNINICLVTTDTLGQYNIIYWDNPNNKSIDSILVYRFDIISGNYLQVGGVRGDSLSQFTDTAFSIGGPNGGNPQYSSWQYKIAARDTCGNISIKSPYHQSIFVQANGSNFSWNAYTIEAGQINPVTGYQFLRDNNNTGNFQVLANTSGLSSTDPNHASFPNANWRVDALNFACTPTTLRLASGNNNTDAAKVKSHSNQNNNRMSGIKQLQGNNSYVAIYPNPAKDSFTIETGLTEKQTLQVFDVTGKIVLTQLINGKTNIDAHNLNEGVYNVSISCNEGQVNKKLIILR